MKYISCLALFIFFYQMNIFTQWQHATGPYGGDILDIKTDTHNNFYAVTGGTEVYVTTNAGSLWIPSFNGLPVNKFLRNIAVNSTSVFVGGDGINVSTNQGLSWTPISSGLPNNPYIQTIFADNNWVFIATLSPDLIFKSSNNGINWTRSATPLDTTAGLFGIINGNVYASAYNEILYKSTNYGLNWNPANTGLPAAALYYCMAQGNNKIYLSTSNGLYSSTNEGNNWFRETPLDLTEALTARGNDIYGCGYNDPARIFYSPDNGYSWANGNLVSNHCEGISSLAKSNAILAVGSREDGVYRSSDNGYNWQYANNGLTGTNCYNIYIDNANIYALNYERGINLSTDNGTTWNTINSNLPSQFQPQTIAARDNYLITASPNFGIYISNNFGASWSYSYTPNSKDNIRDFIIYGDTVIAGGFGDVIYSSNSGTNWVSINNGLPNNPFIFSLCRINTTLFAAVNYHGVYASSNMGTSWKAVNNGFPVGNFTVKQFKTDGGNIAALSFSGVFISTNSGLYWQNITHNLPIQYTYSIDIKGSNIFAASDYGFYISNDLGENWRLDNTGLTNTDLTSIAVSNNFIFSGVKSQSVWRRPISEIIGIKPISNSVPINYKLSQNYPNPFNPATKIKFDIPGSSVVQTFLSVYNILGKEITTLVNESLKPGSYEVEWNASDYPSGIYFYKLVVNPSDHSFGYADTKKMILIK